MRKYAVGTSVSVSRSREQIEALLREFGASGIQWSDEFAPERKVMIRFIWEHEGSQLMARHILRCDYSKIERDSIDGRTGRPSERKKEKILAGWASEVHRLLLLFLKGSLYAIQGGIIKPEQVFMAMLEDETGQTIGEIMASKLKNLPHMSAVKFLPEGRGE